MKITLALFLLLSLTACAEKGSAGWSGWVEADSVAVASVGAGLITQLNVARGQDVVIGQPLFALDAAAEQASVAEALARLARAEAQWKNLSKGRRPSELAALQAQLEQAKAAAVLSAAQWQRQQALVKDRFISAERADEARTLHERNLAQIQSLKAQLETARLAARSDELQAAQADIKVAQAQLERARWQLGQKTVSATVAGKVEEILYRAGEWLGNGQPALIIQPSDQLKIRFFVPEPVLGQVKLGQNLSVSCDLCKAPVTAQLDFIASQPEYTPPVIYSRENRATQVYRLEAHLPPAMAGRLHPGQPVEVQLVAESR